MLFGDDGSNGPRRIYLSIGVAALLLVLSLLLGILNLTAFLRLLGLAGIFALVSLGLDLQWGVTGLINFSVAAFFGLGAYGVAIATATNSPVGDNSWLLSGELGLLVGILGGLLVAAIIAVVIGVATLQLRADYLAIATLGLAEVIRRIMLNERQWTGGSQGLFGSDWILESWFGLESVISELPTTTFAVVPGAPIVINQTVWERLFTVILIFAVLGLAVLMLRRAHLSPWGRVLKTIRSDEDLAMALGKNTFNFKLQAFVLGCLLMAVAGVLYTQVQAFVAPDRMDPVTTFYIWVAVILGGSGSIRGAVLGGFVIVAVQEGPRYINDLIPLVETGPLRLILIGLLIVLLMRLRPQGLLPPQRERIWPSVVQTPPQGPDAAVREQRGDSDD